MLIVTVDGRRFTVKYQKNKESVSVDNHVSINDYPNFVGSRVDQNSTSSDKYSFTFAIHKNFYVELKESLKKIVVNEDDAIEDDEYGKLTHVICVHPDWGTIKGRFEGSLKYLTASEADIVVQGVFVEHTPDDAAEKTDIEQDNADAESEIDSETDDEFELEEADRPFLLQLFDKLKALYDKIKNSAVIAAFNDLKSALNDALLNYQKVMNAFKKVLALPGNIISGVRGKIDFFKKQSSAIKNIIPNTVNQARFNINLLSFNIGRADRTPFDIKALQRQRSGLKVAPIN
jgi:hypothetical protein